MGDETPPPEPNTAIQVSLITGPMKAGKTSLLTRLVGRSSHSSLVVGHQWDQRFAFQDVVTQVLQTHDGKKIPCQHACRWSDVSALVKAGGQPPLDTLFVDECQFFHLSSEEHADQELSELLCACRDEGLKQVVLAGLNRDWRGQPFEWVQAATRVWWSAPPQRTRLTATCELCGREGATRSARRDALDQELVRVGAGELYLTVCKTCFVPPE